MPRQFLYPWGRLARKSTVTRRSRALKVEDDRTSLCSVAVSRRFSRTV